MARRFTSIAVLVAVVLGCARQARVVPYQGEVQNVRGHGAETLRLVASRDPAVHDYVARHGDPDFVIVTGPADVELVYYDASRLVHFHGPPAASQAGALSPLPLEVANVLPADIRAGTSGSIQPEIPPQAGCWHVDLPDTRCRTCCRSSRACVTDCQDVATRR